MVQVTVADAADRRRRAALAGHEHDETLARSLLGDVEPAVRATALKALHRMERLQAGDLTVALADASPHVRRRACELAAQHRDVEVLGMLEDSAPEVVEMAAWALGEQGSVAAVDALAQVSADHEDPLCREAAVAALGAIGDERGLSAILAAISDKPAVRRRAVLALAPFDGPKVETALQRALADRDWQVRQAAEDLLAEE